VTEIASAFYAKAAGRISLRPESVCDLDRAWLQQFNSIGPSLNSKIRPRRNRSARRPRLFAKAVAAAPVIAAAVIATTVTATMGTEPD
jgi:hypothetical protein